VRQLRLDQRVQLRSGAMGLAFQTNPVLGDAIRCAREWSVEFVNGNPQRAVEMLAEAIAICEQHGLTDYYPYLSAQMDLYRVYRAMGQREKALEHFRKAVSLGADPRLLELR
jgi:tetratricopeptide (TPR) repeat protein